MRWMMMLAVGALGASQARASDLDAMALAGSLGILLSSESVCGLVYDHDAIARYIDAAPATAEPSFPGMLQMNLSVQERRLKEMAGAVKVAHCRAIENQARNAGFIK